MSRLRTLGEILAADEQRRITKVSDLFSDNAPETTPKQRIAEREREIEQIKNELRQLNRRSFSDMSAGDRARHRELHDRWSLLSTANHDDEQLMQREAATAEKMGLRKARPVALGEARADLQKLRDHMHAVNDGRAHVDEQTRRRLVSAISVAEIRVAELSQ